jgi:hypothetical protein
MSSRFAIFILLQATEAWLRLPRPERNAVATAHVAGSLAKYPALRMRYFDAEAFSASCSDLMLIETEDLTPYYDFIERLRDSPIITTPYFKVVQIIPAIEEGFRAFEERQTAG